MSTKVTTIELNEQISSADELMKMQRIRHLPVVDEDGELMGVVTQRDLFLNGLLHAMGYGEHAARKMMDLYLVKEAMTNTVVTAAPDMPLAEAAALMGEKGIGCLVVTEAERISGILTEGDFVRWVAREG
jgi:CBS domain-containing protein